MTSTPPRPVVRNKKLRSLLHAISFTYTPIRHHHHREHARERFSVGYEQADQSEQSLLGIGTSNPNLRILMVSNLRVSMTVKWSSCVTRSHPESGSGPPTHCVQVTHSERTLLPTAMCPPSGLHAMLMFAPLVLRVCVDLAPTHRGE
jgi:hypothetical protein